MTDLHTRSTVWEVTRVGTSSECARQLTPLMYCGPGAALTRCAVYKSWSKSCHLESNLTHMICTVTSEGLIIRGTMIAHSSEHSKNPNYINANATNWHCMPHQVII